MSQPNPSTSRGQWLLLTVLLTTSLVLCWVSARTPRGGTWPERFLLAAVSPLERGLTWMGDGLGDAVDEVRSWRGAVREAERLRRQVRRYRMALEVMRGVLREKSAAEALLTYARQSPLRLVGARVIGRSGRGWFGSLTIDAGTRQGVAPNQAVLTPQGVLGVTIAATTRAAKVQLITDPDLGIAVAVGPRGVQGIAYGQGRAPLEVRYVEARADVHPGDAVVTTGIDGVMPRGLSVGTVVAVNHEVGEAFLRLAVQPAAPVGAARHVAVVLDERADSGEPSGDEVLP